MKYLILGLLVFLLMSSIAGAGCTEPSKTHIAIQKLTEAEGKLRERDPYSGIYTLASYGYIYESIAEDLEGLPDWMVSEEMGFPPLAVFYAESREMWKDYISLRSIYHFDTYILDALTQKYEMNIPELDAVLFLWGKESTLETTEAAKIVEAICGYYDIPKTMIYTRMSERELWKMMLLPPIEEEVGKLIGDFGWRNKFGY